MRFNPKLKIEKIADKGHIQTCFREVHLDVERKCLVATNGHMLVRVPVELSEADTTGPVPLAAILEARKQKTESAEIVCNSTAKVVGGAEYPRPDVGEYPDYPKALPDESVEPTYTLAFNAKYLWELAQALQQTTGAGNYPHVLVEVRSHKTKKGTVPALSVRAAKGEASAVIPAHIGPLPKADPTAPTAVLMPVRQ